MELAWIIVLFVSLAGAGNAQQCYQCNSLSSESFQDTPIPGFTTTCSAADTVDCSAVGGCSRNAFIFRYTSTTLGDVSVNFESRGCGISQNLCVGGDDLSALLDAQGDTINSQMAGTGVTYISGEGSVCYCTTDQCNDASVAGNSGERVRAPIMCSLILALASTVFARLA